MFLLLDWACFTLVWDLLDKQPAMCREKELQMLQQQVPRDVEAVQQQYQWLSKDRMENSNCLRQRAAPLADVTCSYNQQPRSLADLLDTWN